MILTLEQIKELNKLSVDEILKWSKENLPDSKENEVEMMRLKYFFIKDLKQIGKYEKGLPYLYINNKWILDKENVIDDRIMGYDGESIGTSTIHDIEEISEEKVIKLMKGHR